MNLFPLLLFLIFLDHLRIWWKVLVANVHDKQPFLPFLRASETMKSSMGLDTFCVRDVIYKNTLSPIERKFRNLSSFSLLDPFRILQNELDLFCPRKLIKFSYCFPSVIRRRIFIWNKQVINSFFSCFYENFGRVQ